MGAENPQADGDELRAPGALRELFRFRMREKTEAYNLRIVNSETELWRLTLLDDLVEKSEKLHTFANPQEALSFVLALKERLEKEARAEG